MKKPNQTETPSAPADKSVHVTQAAQTGHTPGPWTVEDYYEGGIGVFGVKHKDGGNYAPLVRFLNKTGIDLANARLIAAAPELLEELTKTNLFLIHIVTKLCQDLGSDSPVPSLLQGHIELNKTAIDKAFGK